MASAILNLISHYARVTRMPPQRAVWQPGMAHLIPRDHDLNRSSEEIAKEMGRDCRRLREDLNGFLAQVIARSPGSDRDYLTDRMNQIYDLMGDVIGTVERDAA